MVWASNPFSGLGRNWSARLLCCQQSFGAYNFAAHSIIIIAYCITMMAKKKKNCDIPLITGQFVKRKSVRLRSRRFKSWAGQIGHSVASGLPLLLNFSKEAVLPSRMTRRGAPPTRYTLQHNTASIIKDLILICIRLISQTLSIFLYS